MSFPLKQIRWLYDEFGIGSVYHTGRDAWLIILARCLRMFAHEATTLILALFFSALQITDTSIGLFMTLTLAGDVLLSFLLTLVADRVGRRRILFLGSALMVFSGVVFALFENFWILLFAAVVGILSTTGGDFGPFRAIEESTLSHITTPKTRSDVLAWYVTTSSLGSAAGTAVSGYVVHSLQHRDGWTDVDAYHTVFWVYVVMGGLNMVCTVFLSDKTELQAATETNSNTSEVESSETLLARKASIDDDRDEDDVAEPVSVAQPATQSAAKKGLFAQISQATRSVMYKLWFLLIVDSLADGMTPYALTNYYFDKKFHLDKSTLGSIISISYILASCSTVFAGPLARRLGLINTMVFTHLPSSVAVLLFPFPSSLGVTVALFFLRTGLNNMDQAPRSAFIAAVVKPEERTAVMGITSMLRTLASTAGPSVTGILADNDRFWIAFVGAGLLRICYDLGLWALFVNMKLHLHEEKEVNNGRVVDPSSSVDEEELRDLEPGTRGKAPPH